MGGAYLDSVDAGELTKEDHHIGVDESATSSWDSEEVHPHESLVAFALLDLVMFFGDRVLHDEELFSRFRILTTDLFPDMPCFSGSSLVHEESGGFGHEHDADQHEGRENKRRAKHIAPASGLDVNEDGGDNVSQKNLRNMFTQ